MADTWNEESTLIVNVAFRDENGDPVTPDAARYAVHDTHSGAVIVDWTELDFDPGDTDKDIELTPAEMALVLATRSREAHVLTAEWEWGSGRRGHDTYLFDVRNLTAIPRP